MAQSEIKIEEMFPMPDKLPTVTAAPPEVLLDPDKMYEAL